MRILIVLIFVTVCSSCKNSQQLGATSIPKIFESKSFITLDFDLDDSILRRKLLNAFVEEQIGDNHFSDDKIKNGDELEFLKMKLDLSKRDFELYKDREKTHAKLIISYSDKTEIFFLPPSILLSEALATLNLNTKREQRFYLRGQSKFTSAGQIIYGTYFSEEDLVVNDRHFYQVELSEKILFMEGPIKIDEGQVATLYIAYKYFLESVTARKFPGRARACTRDLMEAGMCECTYYKNVSNQKLELKKPDNLEELGLSFLIDGKSLTLNDLGILNENQKTNEISVDLDFSSFSDNRKISFLLVQHSQLVKSFLSKASNFEGHCYRSEGNATEYLKAEVEIEGKMIIKGRGNKLIDMLKL
ncbi:MAG: hypothetical protein HOP07_12265 [Bacteriovoracaceae bacterium]|nr:hypothetical protein [Bacteriovoracaceae bacterium]